MTDGIFKARSDPVRRWILEQLSGSPMTVNQMASSLPISRPAVSQHLKVLRDAELVSVQSDGTRRIYMINKIGFHKLRGWVGIFEIA
ncbi:metalloregulator ArsR/SmtB family transcription factor [Rhizobium sp. PP-F2F-G48]|uniref:ArsR/SmtB family transcription factor n=1 Tax=Rhizobium sp. PP-F2F-G48 TaxID=2135651 RepID=UPI001045CBFE|nr:metalloregulator ArsR/SmtB family transcription factor [Rhizobium sp. PP-F2F-G48]